MNKLERISRYILNEVETSHHLISIRLYFILTILITEDAPSLFIEVPELSQEGLCMCVRGIEFTYFYDFSI
jgi:hypothetical protein